MKNNNIFFLLIFGWSLLPWSVAGLWGAESTASTLAIQTRQLAKACTSWDGADLPAYPTGKPEITILEITVAPGASLPLHQHPIINAGYLAQGELTVTTENQQVLKLTAGAGLIEVVNTWHYGRNTGTSPAKIVVVYVGTPDTPVTKKKE